MIRARGVGVTRGGRALLAEVSIDVRPAACHVIVGANGAGKTTLLRVLAGSPPTSGRVTFGDRDLAAIPPQELAKHRAVVAQHHDGDFPWTVAAVVGLGRLPWGSTRGDAPAVRSALRRLNLLDLADRRFDTLSGGERQRVHLARALAQIDGPATPRFLLLDEPTAAMDPAVALQIGILCEELRREGVGIVAIVHDLPLAAAIADEITLLHAGRVVASGPPREVLTAERLESAYRVRFDVHDIGGSLLFAARGETRAAP